MPLVRFGLCDLCSASMSDFWDWYTQREIMRLLKSFRNDYQAVTRWLDDQAA